MKNKPRIKKKSWCESLLVFFSQYSSPTRDYLSILKYSTERLMIFIKCCTGFVNILIKFNNSNPFMVSNKNSTFRRLGRY
jgi:hypothetical protein